MTTIHAFNSLSEKVQLLGSQLRTHLWISPFNLGLLGLPALLMATLALATDSTPEHTTSSSVLPTAAKATPTGSGFSRYEGEVIAFSYPSEWTVDSTTTETQKIILDVPQAIKSSTITVQALSVPAEQLGQNLIDTIENNTSFDRYFLRKSSDYFVKGVRVINFRYAAVTHDEVSIRGVKMAFLNADGKPIVITLTTRYPHSLGNDSQVIKLMPDCINLINSMI